MRALLISLIAAASLAAGEVAAEAPPAAVPAEAPPAQPIVLFKVQLGATRAQVAQALPGLPAARTARPVAGSTLRNERLTVEGVAGDVPGRTTVTFIDDVCTAVGVELFRTSRERAAQLAEAIATKHGLQLVATEAAGQPLWKAVGPRLTATVRWAEFTTTVVYEGTEAQAAVERRRSENDRLPLEQGL